MRRLILLASLCLLASAGAEAGAAEPAERRWMSYVIAARDLPVGTVVTYDDLMVRQAPEGFFSSSVVKEDSASYINDRQLLFPILKGDPVHWWSFESGPLDQEISEACAKFKHEDASAEQQVARARQILLSHER